MATDEVPREYLKPASANPDLPLLLEVEELKEARIWRDGLRFTTSGSVEEEAP
jgi:hypothetical protein